MLALPQIGAVSPRRTKHPTTLSALAGEMTPASPRGVVATIAPLALIAVAIGTVILASRTTGPARVPAASPPPPATIAPPSPPSVDTFAPFAAELALAITDALSRR